MEHAQRSEVTDRTTADAEPNFEGDHLVLRNLGSFNDLDDLGLAAPGEASSSSTALPAADPPGRD